MKYGKVIETCENEGDYLGKSMLLFVNTGKLNLKGVNEIALIGPNDEIIGEVATVKWVDENLCYIGPLTLPSGKFDVQVRY